MKLLLTLIATPILFATSYTANSGARNWHTTTDWTPNGTPGSGDSATILPGSQMTCEMASSCTIGTNTAGAAAITIGDGTGTTSTAKLIVYGNLVQRGNAIAHTPSNVRTSGYCALTFAAGSSWQFDSSLTTPTNTNYYFGSQGSFQLDAVLCINGSANAGDSTHRTTGGNHVTITSNAGGGHGYITTSTYSAWEHTITYADFTSVGDATNPAIYIYGSSSPSIQLFTLDHVTFADYGGVLMGGLNSDSNFSITHNRWNGHNAPSLGYCLNWGTPPAKDVNSVRLIAYNSCDSQWANSAQDPPWTNFTFHDNFGGWAFPPQTNTTMWDQFQNNVLIADWGNNGGGANSPGAQFNSQGNIDTLYMLYHTNYGHWHWLQGSSAASPTNPITTTHVFFDADITENNCTGNDGWFLGFPTVTGARYPLTYSTMMPPATPGCSPGGIFQGLAIQANAPAAVFDHVTAFAQQGLNMGDNDGYSGEVAQLTNSLFWIPESYKNIASQQYSSSQTVGFKASDVGTAGRGGRGTGICVVDLLTPSGAHNNAGFNIRQVPGYSATQCTNTSADGKGYWGAYSATPGANDITISDPLFVDIYRNLHTYDTKGLGHSVATAWNASATYAVGDLVSHSVAAYYGGTTINYRCIKAHTGTGISGATNNRGAWSSSTAYASGDIVSYGTLPVTYIARTSTTNNQPDVSPTQWSLNYEPGSIGEDSTAGWRDMWEPASFEDLRDALYTYTSGPSPIATFTNWVAGGFAPKNRAVCNSADDGTQIGMVPCDSSVAMQVTGPATCAQGQSCQYAANAGTPPYTYSLVSGSVGSINSSTGAYTAPSHVALKQSINGCMGLPANNVFNTRIDNLPVHPSNSTWMSHAPGTGAASISTSQRMVGSVVNSTDQAVGMQFDYTNNPAIAVSSYAMDNGEFHHWNTFDGGYSGSDPYGFGTGSGDPTTSLSPLSNSTGYLTDGVTGQSFLYSDGSSAYSITGGSWTTGSTTLTIGTHSLQSGDWIAVYGAVTSPSGGINTSLVQLTSTTSTTISFANGSGTGSWVSGGSVQKLVAQSAQLANWVGWALDCACGTPNDTSDNYATVTFTFAQASQLTSIQIYAANLDTVWSGAGVAVPATITVDYSNDGGVTFGSATTYTTSSADRNISFGGWITVPLSNLNAYKTVRVHMTHLDNWLYVSEFKFFGNATPFIFQPFPWAVSQAGAAWTAPGNWQEPDNHYLTTYRDTCQEQENYKYYSSGVYSGLLGNFPNSASGMLYPLTSNGLTGVGAGVGINAAGLFIAPLSLKRDEILAAEAGDVDAIKHATLVTLSAADLNEGSYIWPAQAAASGGCGGCMPYGARARLKSSFTITGPYSTYCATACQNLIQAIIRQQQRYGVVVTDCCGEFEGEGVFGYTNYDTWVAAAYNQAALAFNGTNYEIVNEASLQTNQTHNGTDPAWLEAKIDNGWVTPDNAVVVRVTDANSNTADFSVSLVGVGIGVEREAELALAGSTFTLHPWVTGSTNTAYTCSMSPSGGVYGSISSGCTYTAPATLVTPSQSTITITAAADGTVTKTVALNVLPVVGGNTFISTGKILNSGNISYNDGSNTWWNDMAQDWKVALFPEEMSNNYSYGGTITDYTGTNAYAASSPGIYSLYDATFNDHIYDIHVPNGTVSGTVLFMPGAANSTGQFVNAANQSGFSFDCNGVAIVGQTDGHAWNGGQFVSRPLSCSQTVSDNLLHMVVRMQGVGSSPSLLSGCSIPCYDTWDEPKPLVAGLVINTSGVPYVSPANSSISIMWLMGPGAIH